MTASGGRHENHASIAVLLIFGGGGIAAGIRQAWNGEIRVLEHHECDVGHASEVHRALDPPPTAVVNCAGVSHPMTMLGHTWAYEEEVQTNLVGAMHVAAQASGRGIPVVLIASVAGLYGKPGHVGYSASKAGVISVVQSLAAEGKDIWAVSPGRVDTPMRERDYPADTPGSRLAPVQVGQVVVDVLQHRLYPPGTNVVIRKQGLDTVLVEEHRGDGWRERLRVGEPVTI